MAQLGHRDAGRVQPGGLHQRPLESSGDDPVARAEGAHRGNFGVRDGREDDSRDRGVGTHDLAQQPEPVRNLLHSRCRTEVNELTAYLCVGAGAANRIGEIAVTDRGDVQPRQRLRGRAQHLTPHLFTRCGGCDNPAHHDIDRIRCRRPLPHACDVLTHQIHRQPGTLQLTARLGPPHPRLGSTLGDPAPQGLVPAQRCQLLPHLRDRVPQLGPLGDLRQRSDSGVSHPTNASHRAGAPHYGVDHEGNTARTEVAVTTGGFHLPTAVVVLLGCLLVGGIIAYRRRTREPEHSFISDVDRATYETLHRVSLAAKPLREGLTEDGAARAARHLLDMLHASAVAIQGVNRTLAWVGEGDHHSPHVGVHTAPVMEGGQTIVIATGEITCTDSDCPIRSAVVSPLVVDDHVVGALAAYSPASSPGLARATEEIAGWASSQLQLAELGRERTRAMEAELRALRAQISPHFIYNSLAAIASFVRTDPTRARELLLEFADFTRYALRTGGAFTTLSDELRNVERYLVLEQARYGDRLSVTLLIAPEVLPIRVPYLAVQPLVENAVRHGLAGKTTPGSLTLEARDLGAEAEIIIDDDGVGADPQRIRDALDMATDGDNVGLGNVNARLRQVYGDEYGLVVETAPGAGTRVSFRVPKFAPSITLSG